MRVVVVDHYDSYTWNLVHLVAAVTGSLPVVVEHDDHQVLGRLTQATHLVLSPGPGNPANPVDFALGAEVFALGVPVLGVCLGMQALVTSFGGTVVPVEPAHGEVATIDHRGTGVFAGLPSGFEAVRYHSLAATTIPDELEVNATSADVVMGVRHRSLPLHGVQFHPESILSQYGHHLVRNFLDLPSRAAA